VIFNPSPLPTPEQIRAFPWEKVHWLVVNEGEARGLFLAFSESTADEISSWSNQDLVIALSGLPSFNVTNIICTLGKDGVLAFVPALHRFNPTPDSRFHPLFVPAAELQNAACDTTGAGDCFTGYFVQGLMEFSPRARVGEEIRERDVANILKTCVQV